MVLPWQHRIDTFIVLNSRDWKWTPAFPVNIDTNSTNEIFFRSDKSSKKTLRASGKMMPYACSKMQLRRPTILLNIQLNCFLCFAPNPALLHPLHNAGEPSPEMILFIGPLSLQKHLWFPVNQWMSSLVKFQPLFETGPLSSVLFVQLDT